MITLPHRAEPTSLRPMSTIRFIVPAALLCLTACSPPAPADVVRSRPVEYRSAEGQPLDYSPTPAEQIFCCANNKCGAPNADGSCPSETVKTCCSDVEVCNPEGDACWFDCGAQYCAERE